MTDRPLSWMLVRSEVRLGLWHINMHVLFNISVVVEKRGPAAASLAQRIHDTIYGRSSGTAGHAQALLLKPEQLIGFHTASQGWAIRACFLYTIREEKMEVIIGIDVSSQVLDACVLTGNQALLKSFTYTPIGCKQLLRWAASKKVTIGVLEATGGYEQRIKRLLLEAGVSVHIVNPVQIRHFAKGLGKQAKTDTIDAQVIARFGQVVPLPPIIPPSPIHQELKQLILRAIELKNMLKAEKNRTRFATGSALNSIQSTMLFLTTQIQFINHRINSLRLQDGSIAQQVDLLCQQKGVGVNTAITLIGLIPEIGRIDRRKITALVGLAPYSRDSGKLKGKRFISGGRANARHALYMPAWVAVKHDSEFKNFYLRLIDRGKTPKLAITAVMRKLLVRLNAMMRNHLTPLQEY